MVRMKGASAGAEADAVVVSSGVVMGRSVFRVSPDYRGCPAAFGPEPYGCNAQRDAQSVRQWLRA
jgi:hypothetical protein